jgi:hypothetical protein
VDIGWVEKEIVALIKERRPTSNEERLLSVIPWYTGITYKS